MKLITPEVVMYPYDMHPLIKVEKIGRICYKSDSDYTEETAAKFIAKLIERGHMSVLEHANFVFKAAGLNEYVHDFVKRTVSFDKNNQMRIMYSANLRTIIEERLTFFMIPILNKYPILTGIFENAVLSLSFLDRENYEGVKLVDITTFDDLAGHEIDKHFYTTFQFLTDRGVTHEMVRHRIASFTQESTRYCNYSNDKFGNEIRCIQPANYDDWSIDRKIIYEQSLKSAERAYMELIKVGATAQQARGVLPTDLATTIVMTANHKEWNHFFDLRSRAKTGAPHPNMKVVASEAEKLYFADNSIYMNF